jgi:hypothetical protein
MVGDVWCTLWCIECARALQAVSICIQKLYFFMLLKVLSRSFPGGVVHVGGDNLVYK